MVGPVSGFEAIVALAVFAAVALLLRRRVLRKIQRFVQRRFRAAKRWWAKHAKERRERSAEFVTGKPVTRIRVVDGDTIENMDDGVRYRVANIDCPETDDRAACYRERIKGEQAKGAAEIIFATAKLVEIRPVGRIDRHGRTVAYLRVDDRDYGRLMIERGFAVEWNGSRGRWCGESGGLARLAEATSGRHECKVCGAGGAKRHTSPSADQKVVQFPMRGKHRDKSSGQSPHGD
jgi:endonuclease YncB( thermonuclease family)